MLALLLFVFFKVWLRVNLPTRIFFGLLLGAVFGLLWGEQAAVIKPLGTAFIRLIKMIVVPLIFASLVVGAASLGDIKKVGRVGLKTLAYFLVSTVFSIFLGLLLANTLRPGGSLPLEIRQDLLANYQQSAEQTLQKSGVQSYTEILLEIIPENPIQSMSQGHILQIIFFALIMGIAIATLDPVQMEPVRGFFHGINEIMAKIVHGVIQLAPFGVFALIAAVVGTFGASILLALFRYALVVIVGQIILLLIYPLIVGAFTGMRFGDFIRGLRPAQLIAFSTSSSSATLPVTIQCNEENLGVKNDIASFVLPLGATINMDGTALFQAISALFIAQVYGIELNLSAQLMLVVTAVLASIGTAGAPGVGILMLVIILKQLGIPLEGIALILGVERILDMFRTMVNITSDSAAAVMIAASEKELSIPGQIP
ncbi:dicarboxylate/amino acid:cation symporter [candidate division KSB1 bacterium]|nr:dicarboxylate/amino acid:cation symporter [candidate division KSB1 bacterium]